MDDGNKKHEILKSMTSLEYYPTLVNEDLSLTKYTKLPISNVLALGVGFEPLVSLFQNAASGGNAASGLYKVAVQNGGHLAQLKDGSGYIGSVLTSANQVGSQAVLTPLPCNPEMLFMAATLANIDRKLDSIQEAQKELLDFLVQKEKSELRGDLNFLSDVLNNYKFN